jgi:hypothetical protein
MARLRKTAQVPLCLPIRRVMVAIAARTKWGLPMHSWGTHPGRHCQYD